jgi:hypothetical protein
MEERAVQVPNERPDDKSRMWLGLAGSGLLMAGTIMPIVSVPIAGTISYLSAGMGDGWFFIIVGAIGLIITLTGNYRALLLPAIVGAALTVWFMVTFQQRIEQMKDDPSGGTIGTALMSMISLQWGWAVFALGAVLLAVAALKR